MHAENQRLVDFGDDEALEDRPPQGVVHELAGLADPQEIAEQPGIEEVELEATISFS